ncbi:phospho-N-acetylmuramoyl-pentapeptide-transferase [Bacillus sp. 491mf]|uniref:phospho-N-acetylmuramoyl-pentapeptide- transferase n=1 Tax=Bacillus sp. 491mf TaxID=1761755 RepID=UPI0008E382BB|nr:phospho-N-acetylmuramoyl-pentapeptide-transferase [Bacillus sp. 491mf]SFC25308.1 phospho-N-acetylmuramoyl-pentapeptide-transferase [Bacillus sp. 491mf]
MLVDLKLLILSFVLVVIATPFILFILKKINFTQPIRKELPSDHQKKKGTPLMLGIVFYIGVIICLYYNHSPLMILLCSTFILFGFIGFLDDFWKAYNQDPGGVSSKTKLILQFTFTSYILYTLIMNFDFEFKISLTQDNTLYLPSFVYIILITLFIVGTANAINFTDGMDGLLANVSIPSFLFFFLISEHQEIRIFSLVMIGCLIGFLIYNLYPAKGFMGDTGSLAIGGILTFFSVIEHVEILVPLLFIIYFAEQFSVIIQVYYFKTTGSRIFKMTPIHFHFALKYGWRENQIVSIFGLVSWITMLICFVYYKLFLI